MELREPIESINEQLVRDYGREWNSAPRWRVVFSDDQYEKRITEFTDSGMQLLIPEVRLLPKYKQYIQQRYILERLVPVGPQSDLVDKVSYEPAWVFMDKNGNYLPPFYEGCKLIVESVLAATNPVGRNRKYKDKNVNAEERKAQLKKVEDDLFGNETEVGDHLCYGTGVVNSLDSTKVENIGFNEPKKDDSNAS